MLILIFPSIAYVYTKCTKYSTWKNINTQVTFSYITIIEVLFHLVGSDHRPVAGKLIVKQLNITCCLDDTYFILKKKKQRKIFYRYVAENWGKTKSIRPCEANKWCIIGCHPADHHEQIGGIIHSFTINTSHSSRGVCQKRWMIEICKLLMWDLCGTKLFIFYLFGDNAKEMV